MNSKKDTTNLLKVFTFKYITKYFFYGYLCLFGIIVLLGIASFIFFNVHNYFKFSSFILVLLTFPLFIQTGSIIFSTQYKFRFYKMSLYRLKTRGYKISYFEEEMHEPCMRLIIKDVLKENGLLAKYKELKNHCKGRNFRVENAKARLIEKVAKNNQK